MDPGALAADGERLVAAYESDYRDYQEPAVQMNINKETARSIIRVFVTDGRIEKLNRGQNTRSKVYEMKNALFELVVQAPFSTLIQLNEHLRTELPNKPHVCESTVAKTLDGMMISLKIAGEDADVPYERNRSATINARRLQYEFFATLGVLGVLNECGFNIFTHRQFGRAPVGDRIL